MPVWIWGTGQTWSQAYVTATPYLRTRRANPWEETRWVVDPPLPSPPSRTAAGDVVWGDQRAVYLSMIPGEVWERVSSAVHPVGSATWYAKLGNAPGRLLAFDEITDYSDYATAAWLDQPWRWDANGTRVILAFGIFPPPEGTRERFNLHRILAEVARYPQGLVFVEAYPMAWRGPLVAAIRGPETDWLGVVRAHGLVARSVYGVAVTRRTDLAIRDARPELSAFEPYPSAVRQAITEAMTDWSAGGCESVGLWGSAAYDLDAEATGWTIDAAVAGILAGRARR